MIRKIAQEIANETRDFCDGVECFISESYNPEIDNKRIISIITKIHKRVMYTLITQLNEERKKK